MIFTALLFRSDSWFPTPGHLSLPYLKTSWASIPHLPEDTPGTYPSPTSRYPGYLSLHYLKTSWALISPLPKDILGIYPYPTWKHCRHLALLYLASIPPLPEDIPDIYPIPYLKISRVFISIWGHPWHLSLPYLKTSRASISPLPEDLPGTYLSPTWRPPRHLSLPNLKTFVALIHPVPKVYIQQAPKINPIRLKLSYPSSSPYVWWCSFLHTGVFACWSPTCSRYTAAHSWRLLLITPFNMKNSNC